MRAYTCLALGFLGAVAVGACGSAEDDTPGAGVPPFTEQPASGSAGQPGQTGVTPVNTSSDSPAAIEPGASAAGTGNEGTPDVTALDPSDPPPGSGSGGAGGAVTQPQGTAGQDTGGGGSTGEGAAGTASVPPDEVEPPPPSTQVFLLFGQSNMWGVPNPQAQDLVINPRVEVLTMTSCGRHGTNQWVPAQPPLHGCVGQAGTGTMGPGVGPGDYFGKALAEAFPQDTILLVPNAIPGVSIDVFQPGQAAYNSTLARARMAQQRGEIRGIIFHQGETDSGQDTWPVRVRTVVDRLRADLGIDNVPFVAGELPETGCCGGHNTFVAQLPSVIDNAHVVPSDGLGILPDNLHFHVEAQRTFGRRYGEVMLDALGL
jgi:hypothetical protein